MREMYFNKAIKWYNSIYINPSSDRFIYFFVFSILCLNSYLCYNVFHDVYSAKKARRSIVVKVDSSRDGYVPVVVKVKTGSEDIRNSILYILIKKYITLREQLIFDNVNNINVIKAKLDVVLNSSSKDVYQEYEKEVYSQAVDSDISALMRGEQRIVNIENIVFVKNESKVSHFFSKLFSTYLAKSARILISVDNLNDSSPASYYSIEVSYSFFFNPNNATSHIVDFIVTGYKKTLLNSPSDFNISIN